MATSPSRASASGASKIPEFMPVLSRGAHTSPAEGACVMEYISFLAGEKWTDLPSCTNPALARVAQYTNDELEDSERHRLLPLIPRLMGTGQSSEKIDRALAEAGAKSVEHLIGHPDTNASHFALSAAEAAARGYWGAAISAHLAAHFAGMDEVAFLSDLIDAYDKATGRTEAATVTEDDLRRCAELTSTH